MAHNSNRVNSVVFFFFSLPPLCAMRNRQRHGANLRPIVGPAIVGSMKGAFKSLFLLNCFASAFQRGILSLSLARDNQWGWNSFLPFFPVQMSDIREMNSASVCVCACVCFGGKSSAPAFVQYMNIKGLRERREGPVVFLMVCVCLCVLSASRRGIKLRTKAWGSWISQGFHSVAIVTSPQYDCPTVLCVCVCVLVLGDEAGRRGFIYVYSFALGIYFPCVIQSYEYVWVCKCVLVWVRLSHIKASCHRRLPNVRQAPVFWHPPIHFHSAPRPMTKSVESMIYLFSFLINSPHLHALLSCFSSISVIFPFLGLFLPFPWRDRGMFLCWQNGCEMNEFCVKCADFYPSITLSKENEMQLKNLKTFHWGT